MAWIKDAVSRHPKTVYTAPASAFPMLRLIHDPNGEDEWTVVYAHLRGPDDTRESIEAEIGV